MRATLAVAAREIAEKKLALLGAFLVGLIPLAIPLLPGLGGPHARDVRFVSALFLSLTITFAFPLLFGATVLVSDITHKRFAFYFSRPLPAASIWAGKLLAVLVVSVSGACLAAIPTVLFDGKRAFAAFDTSGPATAYFLLTTVLLLIGAHTVSSMVRLRSAWIVLDFFLAAFFAVAIALSLRSLFFADFWDLYEMKHSPEWLAWWLTAPLIAALLTASYVQVADGRTDARRSHGALSATLWGLTAAFAAILGGLAWWVASAGPRDLVAIEGGVQAAPRGSWVALAGKMRNRGAAGAAFLYDTASGRCVKLDRFAGVAFSANGSRAVWFEESQGFYERKRTGVIRVASLDSTQPESIESDLQVDDWTRFVLSPTGHRLATLQGDRILSVYDLADPAHPKQLVAANLSPGPRPGWIAFSGEDAVRVLPTKISGDSKGMLTTEILELNVSSKKIEPASRFGPAALPRALAATLSENLKSPKMRFLSGGRIVVAGVSYGKAFLKTFTEEGKAPTLPLELGAAASVILGSEIAPDRIALALNPFRRNEEGARKAWKLAVVDISAGRVVSSVDGLIPADRFGWWFSPEMPPAETGSPASHLFLDADGALVRLDPASLKQEILLGGKR
jgi:hypothetical protein